MNINVDWYYIFKETQHQKEIDLALLYCVSYFIFINIKIFEETKREKELDFAVSILIDVKVFNEIQRLLTKGTKFLPQTQISYLLSLQPDSVNL